MKESEKYDRLFGFFKYLVTLSIGAIMLLGTIFGIFFFRDRSALEARMDRMEEEAKQSVAKVQEAASYKIDSIKSGVKKTIEMAVNDELENIFKTQKIDNLIEDKIIGKVRGELDVITVNKIKDFNEKIQSDILVFGKASVFEQKCKENDDIEFLVGFKGLVNLYESCERENQKEFILNTLKRISEPLERRFSEMNYDKWISTYFKNRGWEDKQKADNDIRKEMQNGNYEWITLYDYIVTYNLIHPQSPIRLWEYNKIAGHKD